MNDSNNIPVDSIIYNKIVTSAITDVNGKTIQSSKSKNRISLDENRLRKLITNRVNKIKLFTTFITENNGTKPIKIYSDYDMKISVGIIATLKKL
jgi:tmRNA-binding protein